MAVQSHDLRTQEVKQEDQKFKMTLSWHGKFKVSLGYKDSISQREAENAEEEKAKRNRNEKKGKGRRHT